MYSPLVTSLTLVDSRVLTSSPSDVAVVKTVPLNVKVPRHFIQPPVRPTVVRCLRVVPTSGRLTAMGLCLVVGLIHR